MDIVKKPLNAVFTSGKQGRMLLVGQLVFLLQIITETSYSFGAVFFYNIVITHCWREF